MISLNKLKNKKTIITIYIAMLIAVFVIGKDYSIITRQTLKEYESLDKKIQELDEESSKYSSDNYDEISKYLDLRVKYEEVEQSFNEYKEKYPNDLEDEIETVKDEVNEYYAKAIKLEHELKEAKMKKEESQLASSNNSSGSYTSSGSNSSNEHSYNNNASNTNNNSSSNKHIGKSVYIANGNSYYHAISNCKYLEGAKTSLVTLTSGMRKFECNCWTNPVIYKPSSSSSSSSSGSSSSGGRTVYIASGNSYYHSSSSCKFLRGASVTAVGINNVGGKHACNCIKY